jgi:hypothetical protein
MKNAMVLVSMSTVAYSSVQHSCSKVSRESHAVKHQTASKRQCQQKERSRSGREVVTREISAPGCSVKADGKAEDRNSLSLHLQKKQFGNQPIEVEAHVFIITSCLMCLPHQVATRACVVDSLAHVLDERVRS